MIPLLPWGGSILGMIISLKNNARPKRTPFKDRKDKDRLKYKTHRSLKYKKVSEERLKVINARYKKAIEKDNSRILFVIIPIVIIIGGIALFGTIRYTNSAKEKSSRILAERKKSSQNKADYSLTDKYIYLMNSGKRYLSKQHYSYAKHQFSEAITIKPNSFNANLGLTASLVYDCKKNNIACEAAEEFLIKTLGKFGRKKQLVELEKVYYENKFTE